MYGCHVLAAIVWFGGTVTTALVTAPALTRASQAARLDVGAQIGNIARIVYPIAGGLAIILGVALAFTNGRLASVADLAGAYGITAIVALVVSVVLFITGAAVIAPAVGRMLTETMPDRQNAALTHALTVIRFEQVGFLIVFGCMVAMRFGW